MVNFPISQPVNICQVFQPSFAETLLLELSEGAHRKVCVPPLPLTTHAFTMAHKHAVVLLVIISHFVASLSTSSDADILLRFKQSLDNAGALSNWNMSRQPCNDNHGNWNGVICENGTVWGLQLENMGLGGDVDVDALARLRNLRSLSLMNNNFEGLLPNLTRLGGLRSLFLTGNKFYGEIPEDFFSGMNSLRKVYMANNKFECVIPVSLALLPRLVELGLENNSFAGSVVDFQAQMRVLNLSNNHLSGPIPDSLSHFGASSFSGNEELCGPPLKSCHAKTRISVITIICVSILLAAAAAALIFGLVILYRRKQTPQLPIVAGAQNLERGQDVSAGSSFSSTQSSSSPNNSKLKLTFLKQDMPQFNMQDLLKASAEILGSGTFGSAYKTALSENRVMVVKRFRHMNNASREEFHEHMIRLGRLDHPNLLPIVGFYFKKEEKLFVSDFVENLSLAVHLHAKKAGKFPSPDWPTRLNIIKGVAKGLKYLYDELPSLTAPHGHLKSSNVLLDASFNPLLADYGLVPVINQEQAQEHMIAYKSPEYKHNGRISKRTDVWGLGILILETLTGRFPSNFLQQGTVSDVDLSTWVKSVMCDGSNLKRVLDRDMKGIKSCEGEIVKLLKIGLNCCEVDFEKRLDINDAVEKIEEVKEKDNVGSNDDEFYSSFGSEADVKSSRGGLSDDFSGSFV